MISFYVSSSVCIAHRSHANFMMWTVLSKTLFQHFAFNLWNVVNRFVMTSGEGRPLFWKWSIWFINWTSSYILRMQSNTATGLPTRMNSLMCAPWTSPMGIQLAVIVLLLVVSRERAEPLGIVDCCLIYWISENNLLENDPHPSVQIK